MWYNWTNLWNISFTGSRSPCHSQHHSSGSAERTNLINKRETRYWVYLIFYASFCKRGGAYCFASVGQSVDQLLCAQYLLTPLLKNCQIWYGDCLLKVDVQLQRSKSNCWSLSNGLYTQYLCSMLTKLVTVFASREMIPF